MPNTTPRLAIPFPLGTDTVTSFPATEASPAATILDSAAIWSSGTLVARPAPGSVAAGTVYYATDTQQIWWQLAGSWQLAPFLNVILASANYTAQYGQMVYAQGGVTITLPASSVANQIVGVRAQTNASGASPVTVSGVNIYGVGLNNATSFVLGTPSASVLLQSDGTNWTIVSGQQDTGWVALPLSAGFTITGGGLYSPASRLQGDVVRLKGGVSGSFGPGGGFATLSPPMRPSSLVYVPMANISNVAAMLTINTAGSMVSNQSLSSLVLDGATYSTS